MATQSAMPPPSPELLLLPGWTLHEGGLPTPTVLDDRATCWWLESGHADLFLVDTSPEGGGFRHAVCRLEAGSIFVGLGHAVPSPGSQFVLVVPRGTRLRSIATEALVAAAQTEAYRATVASGLDQWFTAFSLARARAQVASREMPSHGKSADVAEGVVLFSRSTVTWVEQLKGSSQPFDDPGLASLESGQILPVAASGWLKSLGPGRVRCLSTVDVLSRPDFIQRLEFANTRWAQHVLADKLARAEQTSRRIAQRRINDDRLLDASVQVLAGVSQGAVDDTPSSMDDAALRACRVLGCEQGIEFLPYRDRESPAYTADPIDCIARASRVRTRRIALKGEWWAHDHGPMLVYRDRGRVPLAAVRRGRAYVLHDPVTGQSTPVDDEVSQSLESFGTQFYRPFPIKRLELWELMKFGAFGGKRDIATVILMGALGGLLGIITPMATGMLFDTVIPSADKDQLLQLTVALIGGVLGAALFELTRSTALLRIEGRMDTTIQAGVWDRLLALPVPFFRDYAAGDLAIRAAGINSIRQALSGTTMNALLGAMLSVFNLALLFWYSWRLALVALGLVVIALGVTVVASLFKLQQERHLAEVDGKLSGLLLQLLSGIGKLRTTGAETRAFAIWARLFSRHRSLTFKAETIGNILETFNAMFPLVCSMSIFIMVAFYMDKSPMTTGDFLAFNSAFVSLLQATLQMTAAVITVLAVIPLYERSKPILHSMPEVDDVKADPGPLSGDIEISRLSFRYQPDGPYVLSDVSLTIKSGQFVAIVGTSGSGKSTLLRCLLGFEAPTSGAIFYDNQDLSAVDVGAVRRQLGVVLQNGQLLPGDLFQNIVGSSGLSLDDAWAAARMCGLEEDIKEMPMGMNTVVLGSGLSGGQRQRVLIARAIVHRPKILFFDEATSALDNRTQAVVSSSLDQLDATRVVIAHRLSTVRNADLIVVLDQGVLREQGTYDELMARDGYFARLAQRQIA